MLTYQEQLKPAYLKSLPGKLSQFSAYLGDLDWFAGNSITFPDFVMYEQLDQHLILEPGCLDNFANLTSFVKRFEDLPNIKAYMNSDKFMKRPINNMYAPFNGVDQ